MAELQIITNYKLDLDTNEASILEKIIRFYLESDESANNSQVDITILNDILFELNKRKEC